MVIMGKILEIRLDCETDFFTECHKRKLSPKEIREARRTHLIDERKEIAKALHAMGYNTVAIAFAAKSPVDTVRHWIFGPKQYRKTNQATVEGL